MYNSEIVKRVRNLLVAILQCCSMYPPSPDIISISHKGPEYHDKNHSTPAERVIGDIIMDNSTHYPSYKPQKMWNNGDKQT